MPKRGARHIKQEIDKKNIFVFYFFCNLHNILRLYIIDMSHIYPVEYGIIQQDFVFTGHRSEGKTKINL